MISGLDRWIAEKIGCPLPLTRAALEAYQLAQLNDLLAETCRHSTFYRALPHTLGSLAQVAELPLITADDLRQFGHKMVCVSQSDISRIVTMETSGTTAPAKRIYFTEADQALTVDFFACGLAELVRAGDRMLIMMPCQREGSIGLLVARALARLDVQPVMAGIGLTFAQLDQLIATHQVNTIVGMPTHVLALARYLAAIDHKPTIASVLLSGDYFPEAVGQALAQLWGCAVYDHYGSTESGLGGAVDCACHQGMHLRENDLLVEIIDAQTTAPVADGQWGELVITTLTRRGMPLIRYSTGDRARILAGSCPCGSILRRLDTHIGRMWPEDACAMSIEALDAQLLPLANLLDYRATYTVATDALHLMVLTAKAGQSDFHAQLQKGLHQVHPQGRADTIAYAPYDCQSATVLMTGKRRIVKD